MQKGGHSRVQYEGGEQTRAQSGVRSNRACAIEIHMTDIFVRHKYYRYYGAVREYRPARQAIWVVQVVLVASSECGCRTVRSLLPYFARAGEEAKTVRARAELIQGRRE